MTQERDDKLNYYLRPLVHALNIPGQLRKPFDHEQFRKQIHLGVDGFCYSLSRVQGVIRLNVRSGREVITSPFWKLGYRSFGGSQSILKKPSS